MVIRDPSRIVVMGIGNLLMADDGIGLGALAHLQDEWFIPPNVELVDGGTWGMNLLPVIEMTPRLLILDAIDVGAAPGTVVRLRDHEVPRRLATKLSPHQVDLREVLALCDFRGTMPRDLVALGIQPQRIEMSTDLSPVVQFAMGELVEEAARTLAGWGALCFPMAGALHA